MSQAVTSDAQMGMFRVIRPFDGFESVYQGADGTIPIAFPGTVDAEAGVNGMNANLLGGIPTPLGSRVLLQIPMTGYDDEGSVALQARYEYQLMWRTRNQGAFNAAVLAGRQVSAYHIPSQEPGRDAAVFIPAAGDVEIFEQSEPSLAGASAILKVYQQRYRPQVTQAWVQPLLKNGNAASWQQGVYPAQASEQAAGPSWLPLWLDACGDELLILAYKIDTEQPWDFTTSTADFAFSSTYGTATGTLKNKPNIGILISTGTMGS